MADPRSEYKRRLASRQQRVQQLESWDGPFSAFRLIAGLAIPVAWWFAPAWVIFPIAALAALVVWHSKMRQRRRAAERASGFYRQGLARLGHEAGGEASEPSRGGRDLEPPGHLYASDLDLFGPHSLFALLNSARTRAGERTLANWLCEPAPPDGIRARQEAVQEMRPRLDLREDLAVLEAEVAERINPARLERWATSETMPHVAALRWAASAMVALTLATVAVVVALGLSLWWIPGALALQAGFGLWLRPQVMGVVQEIDEPARDLELLSKVLSRLEDESFESDYLRSLRRELHQSPSPEEGSTSDRRSPSSRISRLAFLMDLLDSRRNQMFLGLSYFVLWTTHVALSLEAWRRRNGPAVPVWLEALGELEAISSLAGYAFEHPEAPFPEIVEEDICFQGVALEHPLIPKSESVPNSVHLGHELRLLVVSGSNMSGKTTLLRTVGVNAVLALAGAPVLARSLRISPLEIGATLRVQDSLQQRKSRFYAEITRLRRIYEKARQGRWVLFLLDEILHGTNSHDRAIGAKGVLEAFIKQGAIGLVTTHDLALAEVAQSLEPKAANVHFEDQLEDGELAFDHKLRPGVTQKSNALALMRSVGLEV